MRRILMALMTLLIIGLSLTQFSVNAQDNLLTNGGLEEGSFGPYLGRGRGDMNIPAGWEVWLGQATDTAQFYNRGDKVYAFPHRGPGPSVPEGAAVLNFDGSYVQFNAAIFQTVNATSGTAYQAEAQSQVKACTPPSGIREFCGSDSASGAKTRIGIDPNGGNDPNSAEIVWSGWLEPHDLWDRQVVSATATGSQITVFIFATQGQPYANNGVWIDDVKLTVGGAGGAAAAAAPAATPTPAFQYVPFVNAQGAREDGSVVHTVGTGDTLDSIAVAYGKTRQQLIDVNPTLGSIRFLQIGQQIIIEPAPAIPPTAIPATPIPGGVASGRVVLIPEGTTPEAPAPTAQAGATSGGSLSNEQANSLLSGLFGRRGANTVEVAPTPAPAVQPTSPSALPTLDISSASVRLCMTVFDDLNRNRVREANEGLIAGGILTLTQSTGAVTTYTSDGVSEPYCFPNLSAGAYTAELVPPVGYAMVSPARLRLPLTAGAALNLDFGVAAQG